MKERYLVNLEEIPAEHREFFAKMNAVIEAAFQSPGNVKKFYPGMYLVVIDCELVELNRNEELNGSAKWIANEAKNKWYSDPEETLSDLKWRLGL